MGQTIFTPYFSYFFFLFSKLQHKKILPTDRPTD